MEVYGGGAWITRWLLGRGLCPGGNVSQGCEWVRVAREANIQQHSGQWPGQETLERLVRDCLIPSPPWELPWPFLGIWTKAFPCLPHGYPCQVSSPPMQRERPGVVPPHSQVCRQKGL